MVCRVGAPGDGPGADAPPETSVPPWAMGASRPPVHLREEVLGLSDLQHPPQLVVGGSPRPRRRLRPRSGEQEGLLGHEPIWAHSACRLTNVGAADG